MTSRHVLLALAVLVVVLAPLETTDALACSLVLIPTVNLHPDGEVPLGTKLFVEVDDAVADDAISLLDAEGNNVPFTLAGEARVRDPRTYTSTRYEIVPNTPLEPGDYTLSFDEDALFMAPTSDSVTQANVKVLPDAPAMALPTLDSVDWSSVAYSGPEDPPFGGGPISSCDPGEDTTLMRHRIELSSSARGWANVSGESASGAELFAFETTIAAEGSHTITLANYEGDEHIQCITVSVTDLLGRTSEPRRQCAPSSCEARHKNDRDPIDWSSQPDGCSDWSPGFAERNAPGCACAQSPAAPTPSPWLAGLALLGLATLRRRQR